MITIDLHIQTNTVQKLQKQLTKEAEQEGLIDYAEFEAAIHNMGIQLGQKQLNKLFVQKQLGQKQ